MKIINTLHHIKNIKKTNNKMFVMLVSCTIFFGAIFGYKLLGKVMMNRYFNNMPLPSATITTAKVKRCHWVLTLESVGTLQAVHSVEVTTEVAGVVESIAFQSGNKVTAGDILLGLKAKTDLAKLDALKAEQKLTQQNLSRAKQLIKQGTISKADFDLTESRAVQAAAQVSVQQALLAQKTIRAPFTGQLGIRKVNLGQYIAPGSAIVTLQALEPIYVNFSLPEQDLENLTLGLVVEAQISALQGTIFKGEITAIEPGADPATRNFNLQATFANQDLTLRPGMFAEVTIQLPANQEDANEKVVAIPRSAISFNPYGNSVYVVQEVNKEFIVKRRFIKLGRNNGDMVAVVDGLVPGDIVASSGLLKLRNDAKVIINNSVLPTVENTK